MHLRCIVHQKPHIHSESRGYTQHASHDTHAGTFHMRPRPGTICRDGSCARGPRWSTSDIDMRVRYNRDSSQRSLSLSLKSHQHHRQIVSPPPPVSRRSASLPRVRPAFNAHAYDICAWYGSTLAQVPRCAALPRAPLNRRRSCAPRSRVRAPPTKLPLRRLSQSPPPPPPRPSPRVW